MKWKFFFPTIGINFDEKSGELNPCSFPMEASQKGGASSLDAI